MKAVIVDLNEHKAAVLTKDGRFLKLSADMLPVPAECQVDITSSSDTSRTSEALRFPVIGSTVDIPEAWIVQDRETADDLSEDELFDEGAFPDDISISYNEPLFDEKSELPFEAFGDIAPVIENKSPEGSENIPEQTEFSERFAPAVSAEYVPILPLKKQKPALKRRLRGLRRFAASAAAAAVILGSIGGAYAYASPYGVVSLDVNPSIEYTINRFDRVLNAEAVNEEGASLLSEIHLEKLKHRQIDRAVMLTLEMLQNEHHLTDNVNAAVSENQTNVSGSEGAVQETKPLVVIGANTRSDRHTAQLIGHLRPSVDQALSIMQDTDAEVYLIAVTDEEAKEARDLGTTPGKLHFMQTISTEVPEPDRIREMSSRPVQDILRERDRQLNMKNQKPDGKTDDEIPSDVKSAEPDHKEVKTRPDREFGKNDAFDFINRPSEEFRDIKGQSDPKQQMIHPSGVDLSGPEQQSMNLSGSEHQSMDPPDADVTDRNQMLTAPSGDALSEKEIQRPDIPAGEPMNNEPSIPDFLNENSSARELPIITVPNDDGAVADPEALHNTYDGITAPASSNSPNSGQPGSHEHPGPSESPGKGSQME